MSCSCVEGKYPINIIQGDSYHNAYTFYDKDGKVITAEHIGAVYWNCARLEYQQELEYNVEDSSWIFYLSSTETADFAYCKTTYDLTLYFTDEQVETEIYSSELRVLEKKNKPSADIYSGGEPFDVNGITTNIYTGLIVTAGGGGTNNHATLRNRDLPNQHPMSAITGLEEALEGTQPSGDYVTTQELDDLAEIVEGKADSGDIPTKTSELENDSDFVDQTYVDGIEQTLRGQIDGVQQDVDNINDKIPAQASSSNQLADKNFVNSSVQTATANFRGNWNNWNEVPTDISLYPVDYAGSKVPTTNDYLVVGDVSDYTEETLVGSWRFKYSGLWATNGKDGWQPEYQVNETPLTAAQLAALNSGITADKVSAYDSHITDKSNPHEVTYQQLGGTNPSYTKGETDTLLGGKLSDAPSDGKQYARQDGEWSEVVSEESLIIDYSNPQTGDYANAVSVFSDGGVVKLRKDNIALEMTGYDATHCYFGGTVGAYLPQGYVIAVYAHIGTNGQNYFWYQYNSPVEAAGLYSEDAGDYFTSTNVMGQLQEIGAKLAAYPSDVWQGGTY